MSARNDVLDFGDEPEELQNDEPLVQHRAKPRRAPGPPPPGAGGPTEKARDFKGALKKLFGALGRFKALIAVVIVFAIGSTVFNIVGPKVLSQATTELFNGVVAQLYGTGGIDFDKIARILIVTLCLYLGSALCAFVQSWTMSYVSQKVCYQLRRDIVEKIDRMPFGAFDNESTGDVLSRITNDVDTLGQSLNQGITQLITSVVTMVGVVVMMLTISPLMTLITLIILPLALIVIVVVVSRSQRYFAKQQAMLGVIDAKIEETFSGHTVVRAFDRERAVCEDFDQSNAQLRDAAWKAQFLSGLMQPIMTFIGNVGYVAVAVSGSVLAVQGVITVGDIQAFIQYVKNFTQPITQLSQVSNVLQQLAAAAERIFDFLESPEEPREESALAADEDLECSVEFDHVRFGYKPGQPVIGDFSAKVEEGQTVAIVGPTGAGKTTLVKLLMRFYDVDGGAIRIGGHDVSELSREEVRSLFGMVLQDTWLFSGTVRENIRYGRLDATDEEVEAAARAGYAHHFIQTLPGGYDFVINEDASNISLGQRQLLTISRAILADKRMLILDEATSSVDTRTEERIQQAMDELMAGRTSFVIAHRLSTIRSADLILVIDHGDIVEQGTHEQLLEMGGMYAGLYNAQFSKEGAEERAE